MPAKTPKPVYPDRNAPPVLNGDYLRMHSEYDVPMPEPTGRFATTEETREYIRKRAAWNVRNSLRIVANVLLELDECDVRNAMENCVNELLMLADQYETESS